MRSRKRGERQLAAADCKPGHGAMATSLGVQCFARASDSRTAVPPTRSHVSKAPPRPVAPPCSFCEDAVWRFNGRSWYASDRVSKRLHICAAPEAVAHPQSMRPGANGQRPLPAVYGQPQERAGVTPKIVLAELAAVTRGQRFGERAAREKEGLETGPGRPGILSRSAGTTTEPPRSPS